ncbi:MAG: M4 family metallopeptidase [Simkaniaceae bacterium]|nr:M4 family metallopeptidase [Candidatus Sacchlamyda saccharinae]
MSCHSCGIIPPFLLVSIRDHVAANPEFYEELSPDDIPGVKECTYDKKKYFEFWNASVPIEYKLANPFKTAELDEQEFVEVTADSFKEKSKPHKPEPFEGKREAHEDEQVRSIGAAGAAAACAAIQIESDSGDDDDDASDDARRTRAAPKVLSESLITQLQSPSWYKGTDAAAQRGIGVSGMIGGAAAAVAATAGVVVAGGAAAMAGGAAAAAIPIGGALGGAVGAVGIVGTPATLGGAVGAGAVKVAASKTAETAWAATSNLSKYYFASEDLRAYFSEKHCHQIFISDASKKTTRASTISDETPLPRTLDGIQARSNDLAAERAYQAIERTLSFLIQRYNRDSIDGKGQIIIASIHYPPVEGAEWRIDKQQIVMDDGDPGGKIRNPASLDLTTVAHETFHGMTQHTIGLEGSSQPGALDEHISDVFAILVKNNDLWEQPSSGITDDRVWLIGEDLFKVEYKQKIQGSIPGGFVHALRSLKNPGTAFNYGLFGRDEQVSHMRQYVHTTDDHGGVHINSGIPNKAFYLFATNVGNKALKTAGKVWYATITSGSLQSNAQFVDFANETLRHVKLKHTEALQTAWETVGVL